MTDIVQIRRTLLRHMVICGGLSLGLAIGLISWAAASNLRGAVIAAGTFVVETLVKAIQHPTGGVVGKLYVREGQKVEAGDVLVSLEGTDTRANHAIVSKRLVELKAQLARLEAERDDLNAIVFSDDLQWLRRTDLEIDKTLTSEETLFAFRKALRLGKKKQLRERILQYHHEIEGYAAQTKAFDRALAVLNAEIASLRPLYERKIVSAQRLNALEREAATFAGDRGEAIATSAQAAGRIAEANLQILQIDQDFKTEVGHDLRSVQMEIGEYVERKTAAEEELERIDIRAPRTGIVHQLSVHSEGGVISPGEDILLVVPEGDDLSLDVRVSPQDIDQVHVDQNATVRLSAFNQRTTPELSGLVERIAADLSEDPKTGISYYLVRIKLSEKEMDRLRGLVLVPGMPAEAFIQTQERSALSYFFKPLSDQMNRAFREE